MQKLYLKSKFILVVETYFRNAVTVETILDDNKFEYSFIHPFPTVCKFEILVTLKQAETIRQLLHHAKIEIL